MSQWCRKDKWNRELTMKLRVYLDTSVFSAYYDERVTDRQAATEEFWARSGEFELVTSDSTLPPPY